MKILLATATFIATIGIAATQPAQAMSCSDYKAICVSRAAQPASCDGAWKRCMKSGIYIGPESGKNHGKADKQ